MGEKRMRTVGKPLSLFGWHCLQQLSLAGNDGITTRGGRGGGASRPKCESEVPAVDTCRLIRSVKDTARANSGPQRIGSRCRPVLRRRRRKAQMGKRCGARRVLVQAI